MTCLDHYCACVCTTKGKDYLLVEKTAVKDCGNIVLVEKNYTVEILSLCVNSSQTTMWHIID